MFEKVQMNINTVEVQSQSEHGLRSNFMNLLYTNEATKDTVMETACYAPDTGNNGAAIDNDGFLTRLSFFREDTGKTEGSKQIYAYKKNPVSFIGKIFL